MRHTDAGEREQEAPLVMNRQKESERPNRIQGSGSNKTVWRVNIVANRFIAEISGLNEVLSLKPEGGSESDDPYNQLRYKGR